MNNSAISAGTRRGLAAAGILSIGAAGFAACGTPAESGPSSVVTHTVTHTVGGTASVIQDSATQTVRTSSVITGDYTPPIATGATLLTTTTPPLLTTTPAFIDTPPPTTTTGATPSEPDPDLPTLTPVS